MKRLLFVLVNNVANGGNRILLELAHRLPKTDFSCHVWFWDGCTDANWISAALTILSCDAPDLASLRSFDIVLFSNAFLVPELLPWLHGSTLPVLVCQSFESFCYGDNPRELFSEKPAIENILRLPLGRIAISRSVQNLLQQRLGLNAEYVPAAINLELFEPALASELSNNRISSANAAGASGGSRQRVLFVGDYLWPLKGIADLISALNKVYQRLPIELVVVTSQTRERHCFDALPFPVEIHTNPKQSLLWAIYSSCDLYCCASWYEGFGLPALEAAAAGVPVVSTRTQGVSDYAVDGENLLLANINDPDDLAGKIELLLTDKQLAEKLKFAAAKTASAYGWNATVTACARALQELHSKHIEQRLRLMSSGTSTDFGGTNSETLDALKRDLIDSGFHTQLSEQRKLDRLSREFEQLCVQLRLQSLSAEEAKSKLAEMKHSLAEAVGSTDPSLQKQFSGRYDLCRILYSLADQPLMVAKILSAGAQQTTELPNLCSSIKDRGVGDE